MDNVFEECDFLTSSYAELRASDKQVENKSLKNGYWIWFSEINKEEYARNTDLQAL